MDNQPEKTTSTSPIAIAGAVISILISFIICYGAAKLSYDKYGSIGWAILAFIIAPFYYVYYAYFVSTKTMAIIGGRRR